MRKFLLTLTVVLGLATGVCAGQSQYRMTFCLDTNRVAGELGLGQYTDTQIENGVCMTSKLLLDAVVKDDTVAQDVCGQAAQHFMREFLKRFPGRDPKDTVGRC